MREAERLLQGREYLPDGGRVLELVERSDCSAYDCEYVAVAQTLAAPLLTWDWAVLDAFPDVAAEPGEWVRS